MGLLLPLDKLPVAFAPPVNSHVDSHAVSTLSRLQHASQVGLFQ
jgi:hypothetical protein